MVRILIFAIVSMLLIAVSWRTILKIRSHGFYRFLSWECIAWLFAVNSENWFVNPFSFNQIISWILLIISGYLVVHGLILLVKRGKPQKDRNEPSLYEIEQTTQLIDKGIYKYIRHPIYSSLLFLTWGILFKDITFGLLLIAILSSGCLYLTAVFEEKECMAYFGEKYIAYMRQTKRFIPYII
ncbi:methyltransferase family protein [Mangrovibacterium lignilyticum]|uniref:methyltransferase family protein n=1 Tax=Mangrovibacterium lignilyticum TaxID=2668052 RepID=UPI0013D8B77A|nr:isoprenylcysteine carboxylmethyltransferase family protein [Mangrovibacterium lignilyticum]